MQRVQSHQRFHNFFPKNTIIKEISIQGLSIFVDCVPLNIRVVSNMLVPVHTWNLLHQIHIHDFSWGHIRKQIQEVQTSICFMHDKYFL